jgi:hypothetical protein
LRSNGPFNTTIYGQSDRLRGVEGRLDVLLMTPSDIERHGLRSGQRVDLLGDAKDGQGAKWPIKRSCLRPAGRPRWRVTSRNSVRSSRFDCYGTKSKTPAYKSVPVRI